MELTSQKMRKLAPDLGLKPWELLSKLPSYIASKIILTTS